MNVQEAIDHLDPEMWARTNPTTRLALLEQVRENMAAFRPELTASDTRMKNERMGEALYNDSVSAIATIVPMANTVNACIELYGHIAQGHLPSPLSTRHVRDDEYEIAVFPIQPKDRLMYAGRTDFLRVRGEPHQTNPMDKPAGIIAVLGAGNYSSSLEMLKALFLENCVVVHKPHHLNIETDRVWAKIMQPLVDQGALSFVESDPERQLTSDPRLTKIYFTGGTPTAKAIMRATDTPLVSECGGNNPCIVVPGDRPWTAAELEHQADQIVTIAKLNGGAVCGRIQTLVTCRSWPQRQAFLDAIRKAVVEDTPAAGTYYPGSDKVQQGFLEAHPDAEVLHPEGGRYQSAAFLLIPDVAEDSHAVTNEAFCQILNEVTLDTSANASAFLPAAVAFCNTKLLGTLGSCILVDDDTKKAHAHAVDDAVSDLKYGAVAVNTMPPFVFLSPYLTWGGKEVGADAFVSGHGNFGNALCFDHVEKSVIVDAFMSAGHMLQTHKLGFDHLADHMADYALKPTWFNLARLVGGTVVDSFRAKDF